MRNFGRVLRLAIRYRWTFGGSVVCALVVAVFWGANIGTVYPFVEVAFKNKSLQGWAADEIAKAEKNVAACQTKVDRLEAELAEATPEQQPALRGEIARAEWQRDAEQRALDWYRYLEPYIATYLPGDPFLTVVWITVFLLVGTVLKDFFVVAHSVLVQRLANLATFDLRKLFYRRTLRMDLAAFNDEGTSDLMSRFTYDMDAVANGLDVLFGKLIREPLKAAACLVGAAFICWRLLLLSLLFAPVGAYLVRWLARSLKRANRRAMEEMAQIYTALEETFRGIKIVKAFTNESQERRRFHHSSKKYYARAMKIARYDSLSHPITESLGILAISLALLAGAWLVLKGETHLLGIRMSSRPLSLGALLLFYGLLAGVADPLRKFSDVFNRLQRAVAASDRIYDRLDREPRVRDPKHAVPVRRHHRDIVFEGIRFGYQPDLLVLQDIDLRIGFGERVALVGPNGCGKSTLANLVPRFFDPTAGRILLDGVPLTEMRLQDLRRQIGLVTQETLLFDDTVFNNIRYGCPWASRDDVVAASQKAHAHQFIEEELHNGYDTLVGTLGGRLSGGQRQRISLARAILRDPAIIILDEATSQIDLESEQAIQEALEEFIHGRTAIIITHRMAALALADRIVAMQAGRILDVGSHSELLTRCGLYRRLYRIQFEEPLEGSGPVAA